MNFFKNRYLIKIKELRFLFKRDKWKDLHRSDILLVCHDYDRGYLYQQKYYAQYLDSFADLLKQNHISSQTIAKPFSELIGIKAHGNPLSINRARLFILLKSLVINLIKKGYSRNLWGREKDIKMLWINILQKCKPKIIVCIQPEIALCLAAHSMKIPIYDLQHGVIDENDDYYSKEIREKMHSSELPNGFLCWNKKSTSILQTWTKKKNIDTIIIGNLWLNRFLYQKSSDDLVQEALLKQQKTASKKPIILVSLHRSLQKEYFNNNLDSFKAAEALKATILKTHDKYNWLLRLHPSQLNGPDYKVIIKDLYDTYGDFQSVEWNICSELALPLVLSSCDLHITHHSSVTIDASLMGIPTALIAPHVFNSNHSPNLFNYEREEGTAEIVKPTSESIMAWIDIKIENENDLKPILEECKDVSSKYDKSLEIILNLVK